MSRTRSPSLPAPNPEPLEVLPPALPDEVLDRVATRLRELHRSATLAFSLEVGKVLVDELYGGDLAAWQDRGPRDSSFRKLAEREDLNGLGKSALHRAVQVYALVTRLGQPEWKHLGLAHVRAVLPLAEKDQAKLLEQAEAGRWTTRQLEAQAALHKPPPDGRGRPPLPSIVKSIHAMARLVEGEEGDPFADLDALETLTEVEAQRLLGQVSAVRRRCEEVELRLGARARA